MELKTKNPDFREYVLKKFEKNNFSHHIGFRLIEIRPGFVEGYLEPGEEHMQQSNILHGGVTSAIADIVMGFAAYTLVEKGEGTVTSDLKVSYLRGGKGSRIIARGTVIKPGNLLYYCEADIVSVDSTGEETLIARGYSTMCMVKL